MERTRARLSLLLELTAGLAEKMDLQAVASFVLSVGRDAIDADRGTLCLVAADGCSLEVAAHAGYDSDIMQEWRRFPLDAALPASDAVRTRAAVYLHSRAERGERYPVFADVGGDGASTMLPLLIRGEAIGALVFGFDGEREFDRDDRTFLAALTAQCAIAVDRARLYATALRRQANLALLADVSSVLAAGGENLEEAFGQVVAMTVPDLVDICSFRLLDSRVRSRLVARASRDEESLSAIERVSAYGDDLVAVHGLARALRTGEEVVWDDGEEFVEQIAREDDHRAALRAMNLGSGIIVPMVARGRVLGACILANHQDRPMTDEDRQLARTMGERAAVLLDNARLMRQRREISDGLQAALLPPSLPVIPGLQLGARYEPAGEGLEVGGDFYDVVPVDANEWLLVVGDVTGHGVEAAAVTGLVRHTIHSAAIMRMRPAEILEHLNQALLQRGGAEPPSTYCTVALAALTTPDTRSDGGPSSPSVIVASAGHPAPMLRRADGTVEPLVAQGRLLGYFPTIDAEELRVELGPGDSFVAFTDGVIERRDGARWFREHELSSLVAGSDVDADAMAGVIRQTVLDAFATPPSDDMAILVVRRRPD